MAASRDVLFRLIQGFRMVRERAPSAWHRAGIYQAFGFEESRLAPAGILAIGPHTLDPSPRDDSMRAHDFNRGWIPIIIHRVLTGRLIIRLPHGSPNCVFPPTHPLRRRRPLIQPRVARCRSTLGLSPPKKHHAAPPRGACRYWLCVSRNVRLTENQNVAARGPRRRP